MMLWRLEITNAGRGGVRGGAGPGAPSVVGAREAVRAHRKGYHWALRGRAMEHEAWPMLPLWTLWTLWPGPGVRPGARLR